MTKMKTVIISYHGRGIKYEADEKSTVLPIMFKSCCDFGVSPCNVVFRSWLGDKCAEEDTIGSLNDPIDGDLVNIAMEDIPQENVRTQFSDEKINIDATNPVSVDMSFVSEGYKSFRNISKWVRSRDSLASVVGELVLDGYFPFEVDVRLNDKSLVKQLVKEKSNSDNSTDDALEDDPNDRTVTYHSDAVSKADVLLIEDCGVSQGDTLQFIAKRVRSPLNSIQKEVRLSFGNPGGDVVPYRFYTSDTLSSFIGDLVIRGHFGMEIDVFKHKSSVIQQYLMEKDIMKKEDASFTHLLNETLRGLLSNVMMGELDIEDGDCLFALGHRADKTIAPIQKELLDDPVQVKITVEPGGKTIEKSILPIDTVSSVIGSIVTRDDLCWSIDFLRGDDSITDDGNRPKASAIPVYQRRMMAHCGVRDGDELTLALCMGSNDDGGDAEEEEEETAQEEVEKPVSLKDFDILIEGYVTSKLRRKVNLHSSIAEFIGDLALNGAFDQCFELKRGNIVFYDNESDITLSSSTKMMDAEVASSSLLRVNVKRKYDENSNDVVHVPVAFNEHPTTLLNVSISQDLTMAKMVNKLLLSGIVTDITTIKIGSRYGLSKDISLVDQRNLIKYLTINKNSVIRVIANLNLPNSNGSIKRISDTERAAKRPGSEVGPAEYPPVKLKITSNNSQPEEPEILGEKREFYVVVHVANSVADVNDTIFLPANDVSVATLKKAIQKKMKIDTNDQYMIWQTTCGTSGKPFYVEVWQATQNRCWAHEETGEVLKHVNDNSETRIYHLHDDAVIKLPPKGKPLIRVRTAVEFYEFNNSGELHIDNTPNILTNKSVFSWISGLLVRRKNKPFNPHFYMQASMGFVCTKTGGQFTKATIRSSLNADKPAGERMVVYFVALLKNGSKIPRYPFRGTTRVHVWTRPEVKPILKKPDDVVECTQEVKEATSLWMIYRNRTNSEFEVALSQHFKKD